MQGEFRVYVPTDESPYILGEVILVTGAALHSANRLWGEGFVLVERAPKHLHRVEVTVNPFAITGSLLTADVPFILDAAFDASKAIVGELLAANFDVAQDWKFYTRHYTYVPAPLGHLAKLWVQDRWHLELDQIQAASKCEALIETIATLKNCGTVSITRR